MGSVESGQLVMPTVQTKHGEAAFSCYVTHTSVLLNPGQKIFLLTSGL